MGKPSFKCEITGEGVFTVYNQKGIPIAECSDTTRPLYRPSWGFAPGMSVANQDRIMKLYVDTLNLQGYLEG